MTDWNPIDPGVRMAQWPAEQAEGSLITVSSATWDAKQAEIANLRRDLADYKRGAEEEARAGDEARRHVHQLQADRDRWKSAHDTCCAGADKLVLRCEEKDTEIQRLQALVEAQQVVVEAARRAYGKWSVDPSQMSVLGLALRALDQATTPPEATVQRGKPTPIDEHGHVISADKCGYESLPDEPGRFCRLPKGHAGHHSETPEAER